MDTMQLITEEILPKDQDSACLIGRAWIPGNPEGPSPVWIADKKVYDLAPHSPTISELLEMEDPARTVREYSGLEFIGVLEDLLFNTPDENRDPTKPWLLAPCDLQAIKASGVTFVSSMLERVIEEQARGDWTKAEQIRKQYAVQLLVEIRTDLRLQCLGIDRASCLLRKGSSRPGHR